MTPPISADHLAAELERLEVPFLAPQGRLRAPIAPADLLAGLAVCDDARVRLALIPLLITHPEYAEYARTADSMLNSREQVYLRCYYTATMLLEKKHAVTSKLPDLFGKSLLLSTDETIDEQLRELGQRQAELSGKLLNWTGTYGHGVRFVHFDPALP